MSIDGNPRSWIELNTISPNKSNSFGLYRLCI